MILSTLRERTRLLHERTERAVDLAARLRSVGSYSKLLARFYGFYAPIESRLALVNDFESLGLDLAARRKTPWLRYDLTALGYTPKAIEELPTCISLPEVARLPEALGCLYVLEGATLGGQYVRGEVARTLGLGPTTGCSFFSSYDRDTRSMWHGFCSAILTYLEKNPKAESTIVAVAEETFLRFEEWVSGESGC
jgi:heme oxygenase